MPLIKRLSRALTNHTRGCRLNDLPETFAALAILSRKTNSQMMTHSKETRGQPRQEFLPENGGNRVSRLLLSRIWRETFSKRQEPEEVQTACQRDHASQAWRVDHFASCRSPSLLSGLGGVLPLRLAKETAAEFGQMGSPSHSILLLETVVPRADADQEVDKAGDAS